MSAFRRFPFITQCHFQTPGAPRLEGLLLPLLLTDSLLLSFQDLLSELNCSGFTRSSMLVDHLCQSINQRYQSNINLLPALSEPAAGRRWFVLLEARSFFTNYKTSVPLRLGGKIFVQALHFVVHRISSMCTFDIHKNINITFLDVSSGVSHNLTHKIRYHFSLKLMAVLVTAACLLSLTDNHSCLCFDHDGEDVY